VRIAFYAPLKPPTHPVASGDRTVARLLVAALEHAGHDVELAARLRSYDGTGDAARQARLAMLGNALARRYARRRAAAPPDLWLTYHLYHKAPDWLGPPVATALDIPYVVAEASVAGKRADGPWRRGYAATLDALARADAVIGLNSADRDGVMPHLATPRRWHGLLPFLDAAPFAAARRGRMGRRSALAAEYALDPAEPWLIVVAMMRPGDKLASYRVLAAALATLRHLRWRLLVIGEGPALHEVQESLAPVAERVAWLGRLASESVRTTLAAADLCAWPAINEAWGMALLEAEAAALPVVAGASGGVPDIVADGETGRLVPPGAAAPFAAAIAELLVDESERRRLGEAAARRVAAQHNIAGASRTLDGILRDAIAVRRRPR
jgi:glycosyltransferase involved in cell wall biosynthesis